MLPSSQQLAVIKNYADEQFNQGQFSAAETSYTQYLLHRAQDIEVLFSRGLTKRYLKKFSEALTDFSKVIELNPDHEAALTCRGNLNLAQNHLSLAEADFQAVIALNPHSSTAKLGIEEITAAQTAQASECLPSPRSLFGP